MADPSSRSSSLFTIERFSTNPDTECNLNALEYLGRDPRVVCGQKTLCFLAVRAIRFAEDSNSVVGDNVLLIEEI